MILKVVLISMDKTSDDRNGVDRNLFIVHVYNSISLKLNEQSSYSSFTLKQILFGQQNVFCRTTFEHYQKLFRFLFLTKLLDNFEQ